jgi:hypothetical protein
MKSSTSESEDVLKKLLVYCAPAYIVVDGVDEIEEIERFRLLKHLIALSKECEEVNILISSRPEADIESVLKDEATVLRVDKKNAGSIQKFVNRWCQDWFNERHFMADVRAEIEGLLAPLASNSEG